MSEAKDRRDCPVSTSSAAALAHAEQAQWRTVAFYGDAVADLDAAMAADPGWGLARVAKADFLLTLTEPSLVPEARALLAAAAPLMAHANSRERAHFAAATLCAAGRWREAGALWDDLLLQHPRDLLALSSAHLFDFYRGDALSLRARVARVLPGWPANDPLRPFVLGMHAFGLEECNQYAQAEDTGRRALAACPRMPWAVHAVAHVMEMQGRHAEGVEWLRSREPDWAPDNGLAVHLWWHLALFKLEALDTAGALALFDAHIVGAASVVNLQWLDGAALLWRLRLLGVDVGTRWQRLASDWAQPVELAGHYAFNDCHAMLALIGGGEPGRAQALLEAATAKAAQGDEDNRAMAAEVGLPLMHALLAHAAGDHASAVRLLYPLRRVAHHFGGSHAQRDLIDQTLLASACAATGGHERAAGRALLNERRQAKPATPLTAHWAARLGFPETLLN
jgi:tetratricopeptide (TPR) repeat protein